MPDENKFKVLREVEYQIPVTCGICVHSEFPRGQDWGVCDRNSYQHLKHTGEARGISIVRGGTCKNAVLADLVAERLGSHAEFLPKGR